MERIDLEIYTKFKFLFSYNFLEESLEFLSHLPEYRGCNLYFILRGDSFRIIKFKKVRKIIRVKYRKKEAYSKIHKIDINVFDNLNVPDSSQVQTPV